MAAGGLTVGAGGLASSTDMFYPSGNVVVTGGAMAVTSPDTTATGADIYASSASVTGNVVFGKLFAGATGANAMSILEGNNVLVQVWLLLCAVTSLSS